MTALDDALTALNRGEGISPSPRGRYASQRDHTRRYYTRATVDAARAITPCYWAYGQWRKVPADFTPATLTTEIPRGADVITWHGEIRKKHEGGQDGTVRAYRVPLDRIAEAVAAGLITEDEARMQRTIEADPTPAGVARAVLDHHVIAPHWTRNRAQIQVLIEEAVSFALANSLKLKGGAS